MAKHPQSPQIQRELTRKQLSRAERDAKRTRLLLLGVGGALLLVVLLIVFGVLRESVFLPNEPVAIVGGENILTREFQQRVRLQRSGLRQQIEFFQQLGLTDNVAQASQLLNDVQGVGSQVLQRLIDESIYRQSAAELGVSVSADEVQTSIEEGLNYYRNPPTPAPTSTPRPTFTPSPTIAGSAPITVTPTATITPFPTSTPVTADGFQTLYQDQLSNLGALGIGESDYRRLVETQLLSDKVEAALNSRVVTLTDQVQFQYITVASEGDAGLVRQAVDANGFDEVYGQVLSSTFTITNVRAAEFPFTPVDTLVDSTQFGQRFADLIFAAPISSTFGVISDTTGSLYYVGRVIGHEMRELSAADLQQAQSNALQDWLAEKRRALNVQVLVWEDRVPDTP